MNPVAGAASILATLRSMRRSSLARDCHSQLQAMRQMTSATDASTKQMSVTE